MSKILITSGCSFSYVHDGLPHKTWPPYLFDKLKNHNFTKHLSSAMVSQGNGLISRGIQYHVIKALETYKPEEILVGVMWSHSDRLDYRCEDPETLSWGGAVNKHNWYINPRNFVDGAPKNWVIGNNHWDSIEFSTYYKFYFSWIGASISSLEHILRTQYFLKSKGINYFFTDFIDENIVRNKDLENIEIDYLLKEVDRSNYLPVTSMNGWIIDHAENKENFEAKNRKGKIHPTPSQHVEFNEKVIYPWICDKGYV